MSATGLDVFDKTLQTTHVWLDELMQDEAIGPNRQLAWHLLGSTLRAVRDRLPIDLAAHLGAQLPLLVRGTYYDQFRPSELPARWRSLDEFLERVGAELSMSRPVDVRAGARAVLAVLARHADAGQVAKVRDALPEPVRALWQTEREAAAADARD
jgi:uncharacterized protein (DUF2267 family)